jgi:prepilin-type N-terminal cleavage/methylation domain-containing protein
VNEKGFTLMEVLLAVALMGTVVLGVVPAFIACKDANQRNEVRSAASAAGQAVLEAHRRLDPAAFPSTGSSAAQVVTVDARDFEVITYYCVESTWCDTQSRHLLVEVGFGNEIVFTVETVFTKLR